MSNKITFEQVEQSLKDKGFVPAESFNKCSAYKHKVYDIDVSVFIKLGEITNIFVNTKGDNNITYTCTITPLALTSMDNDLFAYYFIDENRRIVNQIIHYEDQ